MKLNMESDKNLSEFIDDKEVNAAILFSWAQLK